MASSGLSADGTTRRGAHPLAIAWFLLFAAILALGLSLAFLGSPDAGDPHAELTIVRSHAGQPHKPQAQAANQEQAPLQTLPQKIMQPVYAGSSLIADPALIENTAQGPLPRIADDGREPRTAYARGSAASGRPRVAIVVTGMGLSAKATQMAIDMLPPGVTLSFVPYPTDVQRWVMEARRRGHEVLLEVPMEPFDFPDSDPGPHTLRSGSNEEENTQRLVWSLTRFTGYTGVTNLLGQRYLSDASSLEPTLTYLKRRGLLFYDTGVATQSTAPDVAANVGIPFAAGTVIDSIPTAMEVDRRLTDVETRARTLGYAAGTGYVFPVTLERIAAWAKSLEGRGFVLVPASAIVEQPH